MKAAHPFPASIRAALHIRQDPLGTTMFWVVLAKPPTEPKPECLLRSGQVAALLTHDPGMSWPDRAGEAIAHATLDQDGVVGLAFSALADALACHRRIREDGA
jgi:hypothetical protein